MATCIRCGKLCSNGETMCDECKAWFQQKTGGAIPGTAAKKETLNHDKENKRTNLNPKIIGIVIAAIAVVAVLVVVILFIGKGKNVDSNMAGETYNHTEDVMQSVQEDPEEHNNYMGIEEYEKYVEEESYVETENMNEKVDALNRVYSKQIQSYSNSDSLQTISIDGNTCYYLKGELVQIDVENKQGAAGYSKKYYFTNEMLYYAKIYKSFEVSNEVYFDHDTLIRWKDVNGIIHDAEYDSAAFNDWYFYQAEAYDLFLLYVNPPSVEMDTESEFIFPNSDREYLSRSDLAGLSAWELRVGRNEIMARHGRRFKDAELQNYFNSCSWYHGTMEPEIFDAQYESILNQYEKINADLIKEYESNNFR